MLRYGNTNGYLTATARHESTESYILKIESFPQNGKNENLILM